MQIGWGGFGKDDLFSGHQRVGNAETAIEGRDPLESFLCDNLGRDDDEAVPGRGGYIGGDHPYGYGWVAANGSNASRSGTFLAPTLAVSVAPMIWDISLSTWA
jgi:hypothetical protein